jgi:hypothetical protein
MMVLVDDLPNTAARLSMSGGKSNKKFESGTKILKKSSLLERVTNQSSSNITRSVSWSLSKRFKFRARSSGAPFATYIFSSVEYCYIQSQIWLLNFRAPSDPPQSLSRPHMKINKSCNLKICNHTTISKHFCIHRMRTVHYITH